MLYAILGEDVPNGQAKRATARPAHLEHINELVEAGRVILAGPFPAIDSPDPGPAGMTGSLIVAEFDSLEDAQAWIQDDAYVTQGVFGKVTVRPFKQVLP